MRLVDLSIRPSSSFERVIATMTFEDLTASPESLLFSLERAETTEGPWYYITNKVVLDTMEDTTVLPKQFRPGVSTYYRIIIRDAHGILIDSMIKEMRLESADAIALAIETNYHRYLNAQDLSDFLILRRLKTSGHCSCYDDVRMESQDPECPLCGGTGNIGGYQRGQNLKISIINPINQDAVIKELFGEISLDTNAARAWTTGEYKIVTEDLVLNTATRQLFEVSAVTYSMRRSYVIRQILVMEKVEVGDPKYIYLKAVI